MRRWMVLTGILRGAPAERWLRDAVHVQHHAAAAGKPRGFAAREINADQVKIEQLENGIRVRMSDALLYRSGAVELHPNGKAALDKVTGQLANMAAQGNQIDVVGNTDNVPIGPELAERYPTNWELAGARAPVVVRYLQERAVSTRRSSRRSRTASTIRWRPTTPPPDGRRIGAPICSFDRTEGCRCQTPISLTPTPDFHEFKANLRDSRR